MSSSEQQMMLENRAKQDTEVLHEPDATLIIKPEPRSFKRITNEPDTALKIDSERASALDEPEPILDLPTYGEITGQTKVSLPYYCFKWCAHIPNIF